MDRHQRLSGIYRFVCRTRQWRVRLGGVIIHFCSACKRFRVASDKRQDWRGGVGDTRNKRNERVTTVKSLTAQVQRMDVYIV